MVTYHSESPLLPLSYPNGGNEWNLLLSGEVLGIVEYVGLPWAGNRECPDGPRSYQREPRKASCLDYEARTRTTLVLVCMDHSNHLRGRKRETETWDCRGRHMVNILCQHIHSGAAGGVVSRIEWEELYPTSPESGRSLRGRGCGHEIYSKVTLLVSKAIKNRVTEPSVTGALWMSQGIFVCCVILRGYPTKPEYEDYLDLPPNELVRPFPIE